MTTHILTNEIKQVMIEINNKHFMLNINVDSNYLKTKCKTTRQIDYS